MKIYFLFAGICTGPSPGFSSRGGQKTRGAKKQEGPKNKRGQKTRGAKKQEGPKNRRGATFLKYSIGCMQQPVGQT